MLLESLHNDVNTIKSAPRFTYSEKEFDKLSYLPLTPGYQNNNEFPGTDTTHTKARSSPNYLLAN
jgi:hypothetical protein